MIKELYQSTIKRPFRTVTGGVLLGMCALSFYSMIDPTYFMTYPTKERRGSFTDSQTKEKYEYALREKGNSRMLILWPEGSHPIIAQEVIRDSDVDGFVDLEGRLFRHPIRPERRERAQRLYDIVLADSQK